MPKEPANSPHGKTRTVLVIGATGNQGGVTIDHLLGADRDFTVRGLTRTPDSEAAQALTKRGVEIKRGDLTNRETLRSAVDGVNAVVIVTNIWTAGFDEAVRQGKNIADAAADAAVDHIVFSGSGYHNQDLGVAALEPAGKIEEYIRSIEVPATFLRPVWFMHNLEPAFEDIYNGTLALPIAENTLFQMVAVDDVGRAIVQVLSDPDEFAGDGIDLAGDELTPGDMARILTEITGVEVQPFRVPIEDARKELGEEMAELFQWFNDEGYSVDIQELERRFGFQFTSFREYLEQNGWRDKTQPSRIPGLVKALMQSS